MGLSAIQNKEDVEVCGLRPLVDTVDSPGTQNALLGAWPWQVSMQYYIGLPEYKHLCGASLVRNTWLLSAAHCYMEKRDPSKWRAMFGFTNMLNPGDKSIVSLIKRIIIHGKFSETTRVNDIALLKLQRSIEYNNYIRPVCLATPEVSASPEALCYISGWKTAACEGQPAETLQQVKLELISFKICNGSDYYSGQVTENMLCAGYKTGISEICEGDGGGPLMCYNHQQRFIQVGLLSSTYTCGKVFSTKFAYPNLYTMVKSYDKWIEWQMVSKASMIGKDINLQSYMGILVATICLGFFSSTE
uniref:Peptidase S1 domain-containing protein n=1 Tax=Leptobrachium leishanense TaxID=445787 RepID=A0A8C5LYA5_9ANUR